MLKSEHQQSRWLSTLLLIGGVPPMLSGIVAVFFPEFYISAIGDGIVPLFGDQRMPLLLFTLGLQGGDAFVAGSSRVAVALYGNLKLKRIVATIAIIHSAYELWLLPARLLSWCDNTVEAQCNTLLKVEVWAFMAVHLSLVIGCSFVLACSWRNRTDSSSENPAA